MLLPSPNSLKSTTSVLLNRRPVNVTPLLEAHTRKRSPETRRLSMSEQQGPNFTAGDVCGPCPGLSAAANHGYIPRSGVGTIGDFINGTNEAYGMAFDLGGFLGVYVLFSM